MCCSHASALGTEAKQKGWTPVGMLEQHRGGLLGGAQEPSFGQGTLQSRLMGAGPCPRPGLWSSDTVQVVSGDGKSREARATPGMALYIWWWHLSHRPWMRGVLLGSVIPWGLGPQPHGLCFHFSLSESTLSLSSLCQFSGVLKGWLTRAGWTFSD